MSEEGEALLGYVEALPREARAELLTMVESWFRRHGYVSLHDELLAAAEQPRAPGKVIPFRRVKAR